MRVGLRNSRRCSTQGNVLDLGCGAGVPATRDLVDRGFNVTGIDISEVQIERAQRLVPGGRFICAIMDSS